MKHLIYLDAKDVEIAHFLRMYIMHVFLNIKTNRPLKNCWQKMIFFYSKKNNSRVNDGEIIEFTQVFFLLTTN